MDSGKDPEYVAWRTNNIKERMNAAAAAESKVAKEKEEKESFERRKTVALLRSNANDADYRREQNTQSENIDIDWGLKPDTDSQRGSTYPQTGFNFPKTPNYGTSAQNLGDQFNRHVGSLNKKPGGLQQLFHLFINIYKYKTYYICNDN